MTIHARIIWSWCQAVFRKVFSGSVFRRTAKNSFITLMSQIVVMLVFLVQVKIIYGGMGTAAYGSLGLIMAVNQTINSIFDFRVYECLQLRLAEYWQKDVAAARNVLKLAFLLSLGSGIAGFGTVWVTAPFIAQRVFHDQALTPGIIFYGATQLGMCFGSFTQAVLRFFSRFKLQAYILISSSILRAGLLAGVSALARPSLDQVIGVFVVTTLFEQGALLLASFHSVRVDNVMAMAKTPFRDVRATFRANRSILVQTYVLSSVKILIAQMDMFLAGYYFAPAQVGHYRLAKNLVTRISIITVAIQAAVFPEMMQLLAKSWQQARSFILRLSITTSLILVPMGVALFVLAPWILGFFANGQDVNLATLMIRIGIFPLLLYQLSGIWLYPFLIHFRRISLMSYATLVSSALALVTFFLLKRFGIVSVAFVTSTAFVVNSLYLLAVAWVLMKSAATGLEGTTLPQPQSGPPRLNPQERT